MILYICNHPFPHNSGFGIRCFREITILSEIDNITVFSQPGDYHSKKLKNVTIVNFKLPFPSIDRPILYIPILYEVIRNLLLLNSMIFNFLKLYFSIQNKDDIKLYVVSSPLTVPLIMYFLSKVLHIKLEVLEFHDLEPELAQHIKSISANHLLVKIELFLEKILSKAFKKVIVTTQAQAEKIRERTGKQEVYFMPNTVDEVKKDTDKYLLRTRFSLQKDDFIVGYFSTFSYNFTITGIIKILNELKSLKIKIPQLKFLIVGKGMGLSIIKNTIKHDNNLIYLDTVDDPNTIMNIIDVGIVPWEQDNMTETMLPTKLFQYMMMKKAILVPNYGEFKRILTHNRNALLYNSFKDLKNDLYTLSKNNSVITSLGENAYELYRLKYHPSLFKSNLIHIFTL